MIDDDRVTLFWRHISRPSWHLFLKFSNLYLILIWVIAAVFSWPLSLDSSLYALLFTKLLYPLNNVAICCSIGLTMAISIERSVTVMMVVVMMGFALLFISMVQVHVCLSSPLLQRLPDLEERHLQGPHVRHTGHCDLQHHKHPQAVGAGAGLWGGREFR